MAVSSSPANEFLLINALKSNVSNSTSLRPDTPTYVSLYQSIQKTLSLTNAGVLSVTAMMVISWIDPRLTWSYSSYPFNTTNMPRSSMWSPAITLSNSASGSDEVIPSTANSLLVTLDGKAVLIFTRQLTTSCTMDLTNFPFDSQLCRIRFISLDINNDSPNVEFLNDSSCSLEHYSQNGEFQLQSISMSVSNSSFGELFFYDYNFPMANVTLTCSRQSSYYISTMIAPAFILLLILAFVLIIPSENSIKISVSCTLLLSLYTLQQSVARALPPSEKSSSLAIGIFSCMFLAGGTVLLTILTVVFKMLGPSFFVKFCKALCQPTAVSPEDAKILASINVELKDSCNFPCIKSCEENNENECKTTLETSMLKMVSMQQKVLEIMENQQAAAMEASAKQKKASTQNEGYRNFDMLLGVGFFFGYLAAALACLIVYMTKS